MCAACCVFLAFEPDVHYGRMTAEALLTSHNRPCVISQTEVALRNFLNVCEILQNELHVKKDSSVLQSCPTFLATLRNFVVGPDLRQNLTLVEFFTWNLVHSSCETIRWFLTDVFCESGRTVHA